MSLPQEPLVIRRRGFSPLFRYSCLHSHSCGLHGSVTRPLRCPHDAPLPEVPPGPTPQEGGPGARRTAIASAVCLSPATLSARNHLTSELSCTLSRLPASK